jgi:hypothetical protein
MEFCRIRKSLVLVLGISLELFVPRWSTQKGQVDHVAGAILERGGLDINQKKALNPLCQEVTPNKLGRFG